ncbi:HrgA protein [Sphingomonas albertensis]|uniref:HrgA protein n=1 Tax=Sphingomonas albertensis TaxID=2762591 RepID=A0ABR7ANG5_9SPHN|nr:HrgA protein [Sphingomonas albertensis]MBC3942001.1 HrgA protein [Sphingomonas albertensis]
MAASLKLRETVFKCLSIKPGAKLKAREIAEWIIAEYPEEVAAKIAKSKFITDINQLRNQLVAEIGANRPNWESRYSSLRSTADKPRRYYWTTETDEQVVTAAESLDQSMLSLQPGLLPEALLYAKLREFVIAEFDVVTMRIDEKTASNKKGPNANKWLYPDVCGLQSRISGYGSEVLDLIRLAGGKKATLWSFEVKVILNTSNVRESYFQTVSNSSWANFGYLVASQIDEKVMPELRVLHNLHGIGIIQLNHEDPVESQTLIPALQKEEIDWGAMNRLASENADFREYSKRAKHFYQTDDANPALWK